MSTTPQTTSPERPRLSVTVEARSSDSGPDPESLDAPALLELGVASLHANNLSQATERFIRAASIAASDGDTVLEGRAYGNVATTYARQKDHDAALAMYQKALSIFQAIGDKEREAKIVLNMALSHVQLNRLPQAEDLLITYKRLKPDPDSVKAADAAFAAGKRVLISTPSSHSLPGVTPPPVPLHDSGAGTTSGTRMLEYRFENLRWQDVVARVQHGIATTEVVLSLLRSRATAEERYAKALKELAEVGGSSTSTTGGMLSAFNNLLSGKSDVSSDLGTLYGALEASKKSTGEEAAQRAHFAMLLGQLGDEVADLRSSHQSQMKRLVSQGRELISAVRNAAKKLVRANNRLERARNEELMWRERVAAVHEGGSTGLTDNEIRKRTKHWSSASAEMSASEAEVRDTANRLVMARNARGEGLTELSQQLQRMEEERLATLSRLLCRMADANVTLLSVASSAHRMASDTISSSDPQSDIRMFIHKRRVQLTLSEAAKVAAGIVHDDDGDESGCIVPMPVTSSVKAQFAADYISHADEVGPLVVAWVAALFRGEGKEVYDVPTDAPVVPPAPPEEFQVSMTPFTDVASAASTPSAAPVTPTASAEDWAAPPDGDVVVHVDDLFRHRAGRAAFIRCLNKQRAAQQNVGDGFDRLARIMKHFLDACQEYDDVDGIKMLMIMSETFYRPAPGPSPAPDTSPPAAGAAEDTTPSTPTAAPPAPSPDARLMSASHEFVQRAVCKHRVWSNPQYWEEAFYRSVREEVVKLSPEMGDTPSKPGVTIIDPSSADWRYTYRQIVFGQLASYALNMRSFELPPDDANRIVKRLAEGNGLPSDMLQTLFINADDAGAQ